MDVSSLNVCILEMNNRIWVWNGSGENTPFTETETCELIPCSPEEPEKQFRRYESFLSDYSGMVKAVKKYGLNRWRYLETLYLTFARIQRYSTVKVSYLGEEIIFTEEEHHDKLYENFMEFSAYLPSKELKKVYRKLFMDGWEGFYEESMYRKSLLRKKERLTKLLYKAAKHMTPEDIMARYSESMSAIMEWSRATAARAEGQWAVDFVEENTHKEKCPSGIKPFTEDTYSEAISDPERHAKNMELISKHKE